MSDLRYIKEKKVFNRYMKEVVKDTGKVSYGEVEVRKALVAGAIDLLLISEKLDKVRIFAKCNQCGHEDSITIGPKEVRAIYGKIRSTPCPSCHSNRFEVSSEEDLIEEFGQMAEEQGTKIMMMSIDTEEGTTLFHTFGGIAALLRFAL